MLQFLNGLFDSSNEEVSAAELAIGADVQDNSGRKTVISIYNRDIDIILYS